MILALGGDWDYEVILTYEVLTSKQYSVKG